MRNWLVYCSLFWLSLPLPFSWNSGLVYTPRFGSFWARPCRLPLSWIGFFFKEAEVIT